jgi:lipoprotein-releasing system permease protein
LNIELLIAKKMMSDPDSRTDISKPVISFAIAGISLGIAAMILSAAIVTGFKSTIKEKVFGFGAHINITNFDSNISYESVPVSKELFFVDELRGTPGIQAVYPYAIKAGMVRSSGSIQGVLVKGIDSSFCWDFFASNLTSGSLPVLSADTLREDALISQHIAGTLNLSIGDRFVTSFVSSEDASTVRHRRFQVSGIYKTNMEEFDKMMLITDLRHIQSLNGWEPHQVTGLEVRINNPHKLGYMLEKTWDIIGYGFLPDGTKLKTQTIEDMYPHIFDWLSLLDMNVWVILALMTMVAGMNMISGLLVIILEKTNMIGLLKALGAKNASVRKIFLYHGAMLISKGMLYGNLLGISLCLAQYYGEFFPLDATMYFVHTVPINLNIAHLLAINTGSMAATFAMLVLPSYAITSISPVEAIRFG